MGPKSVIKGNNTTTKILKREILKIMISLSTSLVKKLQTERGVTSARTWAVCKGRKE